MAVLFLIPANMPHNFCQNILFVVLAKLLSNTFRLNLRHTKRCFIKIKINQKISKMYEEEQQN